MSLTVLDVVQKVLNDMGSFAVNSISDLEESLMISSILEDKYYQLMHQKDWPTKADYITLDSSGAGDGATTLSIPSTVEKIDHIKYNYVDQTYLEPEQFLALYMHDPDLTLESNQVDVDVAGGPMKITVLNDKDPQFYTSFDDELLVFDSYLSTTESKLVGTKALAFAYTIPTIVIDDTTPIPIPKKMESLLISEVKAASFKKLKQMVSEEDERDRRAQHSRLNKERKQLQDKDKTSRSGFGRC